MEVCVYLNGDLDYVLQGCTLLRVCRRSGCPAHPSEGGGWGRSRVKENEREGKKHQIVNKWKEYE